MKFKLTVSLILIAAVSGLLMTGCEKAKQDATKTTPVTETHDHKHDHDKKDDEHAGHEHAGHEHGDWWCNEHGVPEEVCTRCDASLVAAFKKKGDWCEKHDRPDSQCFICNPKLAEKFAARYETKYNKQPPKPEPEEETEKKIVTLLDY